MRYRGNMPSGRPSPSVQETRERILLAAEHLLADGGPEAVATRAVSASAGVQAPTIYRIFGDKQGLLDEVARAGFERYLDGEQPPGSTLDALDDLRAGWDQHVGFALANPYLYALVYGDPDRLRHSPTAAAAEQVVALKVHRLATEGLLRVSEERATQLLLAAGCGTSLVLIATPPDRRDEQLSPAVREACIAALTTQPETAPGAGSGRVGAAVALRADLESAPEFTPGEKLLMAEWLTRIVDHG
jgi:AcrR family transcriptional regulator